MNDMTPKRIIDAHLHLSPMIARDARVPAKQLDQDLAAAGIEKAVVLHLLYQPWSDAPPWSAEEFAEAISAFPRLRGFVNIDPLQSDACAQLRNAVERLGYIGLKLHPRLQRFDLGEPGVQRLVAHAGEMGVPVLIDAFPDGDWLMMGFDPLAFACLARSCPQTKIVIAHFGGHHCIDFMMLAKRIPNIWFDLSYSLLYYAGSSVVDNLLYCCKSMRYKRVMYGSDYPDRSIADSVRMSLKIFEEHGIEDENLDALLWRNAVEFFGWPDL